MDTAIVRISDNAATPLGLDTESTLEAVLAGASSLRRYRGDEFFERPLADNYVASFFDRTQVERRFNEACLPHEHIAEEGPGEYLYFDKLSVVAALPAIRAAEAEGMDVKSDRVLFVFSTTRGDGELLEKFVEGGGTLDEGLWIANAARKVARFFGNRQEPVCVSNACTSGACAQLTAWRALAAGRYDYVVVIGAEVQSRFIISGFQSFMAVSDEVCRPFDAERKGLNAGEAAACIVYARKRVSEISDTDWVLCRGAVRNDANHISGPSRTGEGEYRALQAVLDKVDKQTLALVNVHGTATVYNDEMESIALQRAGLLDIPVNGLKGIFGHTMGAAGVLECVLSMHAVERGMILGTRGFEKSGVSQPVNISADNRKTDKKSFIKLLSGFGGCNAALLFTQGRGGSITVPQALAAKGRHKILKRVRITQDGAWIDGVEIALSRDTEDLLTALYRAKVGDYPKFFKMDLLCKAGFLSSELLLRQDRERIYGTEDTAVILFSRTGSYYSDLRHQQSISDKERGFAHPGTFVYTLPSIVTGEIAIRNKLYGESLVYLLGGRYEEKISAILEETFTDSAVNRIITGWMECVADDDFEVELFWMERE